MKLVHDDYTLEGLADYRLIIWKILLDNSRSIVQSLRRLSPEHVNRATDVCSFPHPFALTLIMDTYVGVPPSRLTANT